MVHFVEADLFKQCGGTGAGGTEIILGPEAGAEIIFIKNIFHSKFRGCQDEKKAKFYLYCICKVPVLPGTSWQKIGTFIQTSRLAPFSLYLK